MTENELDEIEWRLNHEADINMISSFWRCKKCNHAQHQFLNTDDEWEAIAMVRDYAGDHVAVCEGRKANGHD